MNLPEHNVQLIAEGFKGERAIEMPEAVVRQQRQNHFVSRIFLTKIGYYPEARHHFRSRPEGSSDHILIFCVKGRGWIKYKDDRIILSNGDFFIIPSNEPHGYGADKNDPWTIYWLHFRGSDINNFSNIIGTTGNISTGSRTLEKYNRMFEHMLLNMSMGYSSANLGYLTCYLYYFLGSLKYPAQYQLDSYNPEDIVQQSILFMKHNLEKKITLKEIAGSGGYSPSHFTVLFTNKTSYPPMVYFNQLKIQQACTYLRFSSMKIKEITFRLGYYDPFHFSRAFKKEMMITPRQYRQNLITDI